MLFNHVAKGTLVELSRKHPKLWARLQRTKKFAAYRAYRLVVLGRAKAGKSSVINALFGRWISDVAAIVPVTPKVGYIEPEGLEGILKILDTRGYMEAGENLKVRLAELAAVVQDAQPDVVLYCVPWNQVTPGIAADLAALEAILDVFDSATEPKSEVPFFVVLTQCDQETPKELPLSKPFHLHDEEDHEDYMEKRARIQLSVTEIIRAIQLNNPNLYKRLKIGDESTPALVEDERFPLSALGRVVAVDSELRFSKDKKNIKRDLRWNYDHLRTLVFKSQPDSTYITTAIASYDRKTKVHIAWPIVVSFSLLCGGIAALPVPFLDGIPITALQLTMLGIIKSLAIEGLRETPVWKFCLSLGVPAAAAVGGRILSTAITSLIPVIGTAFNVGATSLLTLALGLTAIYFYILGKDVDGNTFKNTLANLHPPSEDGDGDGDEDVDIPQSLVDELNKDASTTPSSENK